MLSRNLKLQRSSLGMTQDKLASFKKVVMSYQKMDRLLNE